MTPYPANGLDFPLRQALPTSRQEDRNRVRRAHDLGADLKEAFDEFHRLDIGHRAKDGASEALARRAWFSAPRKCVESLGDPSLEEGR